MKKTDDDGSVSLIVIFPFALIFLFSILLFFVFNWEIGHVKSEISSVVNKVIWSTRLDDIKQIFKGEVENKMLCEHIKHSIKNNFMDSENIKNNHLLKKLADKKYYGISDRDSRISIDVKLNIKSDFEDDIPQKDIQKSLVPNGYLVIVDVKLKLPFPRMFLLANLNGDYYVEGNIKESRCLINQRDILHVY